ncbi:MAG: cardiolipin synthase B [Betaproteobacteria bacterium]|nr:cardiolipin synthase B [Betaproteobacteria bacterium]
MVAQLRRIETRSAAPLRLLAEQALSRTAGAPLVPGNRVRLLRDAHENYPAWLNAIAGAQHTILFENYIIESDTVGERFVAALVDRVRAGVRVYVIYDWFGGLGLGSRDLLAPLAAAGAQVRVFNKPWIGSPFGWMQRDHRKMIAVDGRVGYVSGLCVSARWEGDSARGVAPWRDTGIEISGPAVLDLERAFAQVWAACGATLPEDAFSDAAKVTRAGNTTLRVMANQPNHANLYRLDQLIATMATRTLWLTDAYYVGMVSYVQALRAAARDGVDVRLLVPGVTNLIAVSPISRAGYRTLLEAGIRVFEWNGPMLHAKTAVADGLWARVGSTNLNITSWISNYELDVAVEDADFAAQMEALYEEDLNHATEVVLSAHNRVRPAVGSKNRRAQFLRRGGDRSSTRFRGSATRAAAGALRIGNTVGAAMGNRRLLGPAEAGIMVAVAAALLAIVGVGLMWPRAVVLPLSALGVWIALTLLVRAYLLRRRGHHESEHKARDAGRST